MTKRKGFIFPTALFFGLPPSEISGSFPRCDLSMSQLIRHVQLWLAGNVASFMVLLCFLC
uniref:Uncharacterized protein n=1 Tax=Anguilla anguilla TaxID=7936 RepID=A0A0E9S4G1_ANGAN